MEWLRIGADVAVVATVAVMIWLYYAGRDDLTRARRQELAGALLMAKYDENLRASQQRVSDYIKNENSAFTAANLARQKGGRFPPQQVPIQVSADIQKLTDFYTDIVNCAEQNICDRAMVDLWFHNDIRGFACNVELIGLPELRPTFGADYGAKLKDYVGGCGFD